MTSVLDFLSRVGGVDTAPDAPPVCRTLAAEFEGEGSHRLRISVGRPPRGTSTRKKAWCLFRARGRRGVLASSHARHLYAFARWIREVAAHRPLARFATPRFLAPAFDWQRPVFDLYFAQSCRTVRHMNRADYAREMARAGFTHLEVNALASPEAMEKGVAGEIYPRFYTYCPALDQFVDSSLNRGVYRASYLKANLARLKEGARLADRYGLVPTLTCFEPRSVPDELLRRYPELRGCRVDHPFRSFHPRYNLAVSHPIVREHYREMMTRLMQEVPTLGCLSVWSNDSGAGFEFTRSLYVGANGSAYLAREWSDEDVFSAAAAANAVGFLRLLQESAAAVNPDFRVATRLEPFGPEREAVIAGLGRGLDVEVPTLLAEGWDAPYRHPTYDDSELGPFTIYNNAFQAEERGEIRRLGRRDCRTHVVHAHGPVNNFEPLMGIPSPWLTHEKLTSLHRVGAKHLAHVGGVAPPASVPWDVNAETHRRFVHAPGTAADDTIAAIAADWVGGDDAGVLFDTWRLTEQAIRGFMPNRLFFLWGVWYRLFVRPLVPDIEAVPEKDRAYYERHMLSTHHNPGRFDLSRDVLFRLVTPRQAQTAVGRIDRHALPNLARARARLEDGPAGALFDDLRVRLAALSCWMVTRRNVAAWIANVCGYVETTNAKTRATCRKRLDTMVALEIENARTLLALWSASTIDFMAVSADRETTFIYDRRFPSHLRKKIRLMERYGDREPHIDPDIRWRTQEAP